MRTTKIKNKKYLVFCMLFVNYFQLKIQPLINKMYVNVKFVYICKFVYTKKLQICQ